MMDWLVFTIIGGGCASAINLCPDNRLTHSGLYNWSRCKASSLLAQQDEIKVSKSNLTN